MLGAFATSTTEGPTRDVEQPPRTTDCGSETRLPDRIARFELLEEIGRGGMGVVFRAHDPELDREVALKLVRPPSGTRESFASGAHARTLREAQAMAAITHPNVIPVFDVLHAAEGLCIAMEYVRGPTLRAWIETPRSWRDVLEVFRQAGEGLGAAHDVGLCHRDFKPSNVLVGLSGAGLPWVRVVDFGLARVLEGSASQRSAGDGSFMVSGSVTETGSVMGTPAYMSPEQHLGREVTPASDQYAFCVSLYWALYGALPFPTRGRTLRQILSYKLGRVLPRRPPERDVPRWLHALVLRGLSPDPGQRFPSMRALLDALASRRARGRAGWWGAGALVGVSAVAGLFFESPPKAPCALQATDPPPWSEVSRSSLQAGLSEVDADATWAKLDASLTTYAQTWSNARGEVCGGPRPEAGLECLARARRSVETLEELLAAPDPELLRRADALVEALPDPQACLGESARTALVLPEDPERALDVATLGRELTRISVIMSAGRYEAADEALRPVEQEARALAYAPLLARVLVRKGQVARLLGRYDDSEAALLEAHARALDGDDAATAIDAASALTYLLGYRLRRFDEGERWYRDAEASIARSGMQRSTEAALLWDNWGSVLTASGRFEEGLAAHQRALSIRDEVEDPHSAGHAVSMSNIGGTLLDLDRKEEAVAFLEKALAIRRDALGPEHPKTLAVMGNLATAYDDLGKTVLARSMLEEVIALQERALGPDHVSIATSATNLSAVLHGEREFERALALQRRALAIWEATYGPDHARVAVGHNNIASTLRELGRSEEAVTQYARALAVAESAMGSEHPTVATFLDHLGDMMRLSGRYPEAIAYVERALAVRTAAFGEEHRVVADSISDLALCHKGLGEFDRALELQQRAAAIYRNSLGEDHPSYFAAQSNLANALAGAGRREEARALHAEVLAKREARFGAGHFETASSHVNLADVLLAMGRPKEALPHFDSAHQIWSEALPAGDARTTAAQEGRDACKAELR